MWIPILGGCCDLTPALECSEHAICSRFVVAYTMVVRLIVLDQWCLPDLKIFIFC